MTRRLLAFLLVGLFAVAGPVAAQQENLKAAALIGLARTRRDAGDLAEAARYFAAARAVRPFTADELAEYFWVLRPENPREALGIARDVLRTTPKLTTVREGAIAAALDLGDESTVQAFAEEGRMLDANTALWHRRLGESYLRLRDYARAADTFAQAVRKKDRMPDDALAFAVALTAAERNAEAIEAWAVVPRDLVAERLDLQRLELQVIARAGAPTLATARLDEWLTRHPEDRLVRGWAVDAWERAGSPARALDTLRPLMEGPDPASWLRRGATLAMQLGRRADAIVAYEGLLTAGAATRADKVTYIGLALRSAKDQRALGVLDDLLATARGCDDQLLPFVERMAGADATDRVLREARKPGCADARWGRRAVERTGAERRFTDALGVISQMQRRDAAMTRTRGLLLAWTGDHAGAIDALMPVLAAAPADTEVRLTLVDANRAIGRAYAAWQVASSLLDQPSEASGAALLLANVALEADQPEAALRLARSGMATDALVEVMGRAHLALGNPALAAATLRGRVASLGPQAALALIDAISAIDGPRAAAVVAAGFDGSQPSWEDVGVRQLELARLSGKSDGVSPLERQLCAADAWPCQLAAAEAAQMAGRPLEALKTAEALRPTAPARQRRLDELRAWALSALGEHAKAAAILSRLIESTPGRLDLLMESRLVQWLSGQTSGEPVLTLLEQRAPRHLPLRARVAQALLSQGRAADAADLLRSKGLPPPTLDARLVLARALRTTGDMEGALTALGTVTLAAPDAVLLKADLQTRTGRRVDAVRTLRAAIRSGGGTESTWLALVALSDPGTPRLDVLREALTAVPSSLALRVSAATEWLRTGNRDNARSDADLVLKQDPTNRDAWMVRADVVKAASGAEAAAFTSRLMTLAPKHGGLVLAVADHVAGLVRSSGPELPRRLAVSLRDADARWFPRANAKMTVARLFAAVEDWTPALASVQQALADAPDSRPAQRLRADILGWSGRHEESLAAYDRYLADGPMDWDAARQRARVAGWAGMYARAGRYYDDLLVQFPDDTTLRAEATAKRAFFEGRWRDAATAYGEWIARDPDSSEARFERAAALKAAGDTAAWERSLVDLKVDAGHRLAAEALQQALDARRPRLSIVSESRTASGYAGARLLNLARDGGRMDVTRGAHGGVLLSATYERVRVSTPTAWRAGDYASIGLTADLSTRAALDGRVGLWVIGRGGIPDSRVGLLWDATDRASLSAGFEVTPVLDNLSTIDRGLVARGPFAQARWATPNGGVEARVSAATLQDGNRRTEVQGSVAHRLPVRGLQVMGWSSLTRNSQPSTLYFSPDHFARVDLGLEYTRTFRPMRFADDRQKTVRATYLQGTDNRGTLYYHPAVTFELPLSRQFAVSARGDWVRSATYRETSVYVGLTYTAASGTP